MYVSGARAKKELRDFLYVIADDPVLAHQDFIPVSLYQRGKGGEMSPPRFESIALFLKSWEHST